MATKHACSTVVYPSLRGSLRHNHIATYTYTSFRTFHAKSVRDHAATNVRNVSTTTPAKASLAIADAPLSTSANASSLSQPPPLARMPTPFLLRSILLSSIMSSRILLAPCLYLLDKVATSKSFLFNPEKNVILDKLLRMTVYKHFCAGATPQEINSTISLMKQMGYKGIILGYSREVVVRDDAKPGQTQSEHSPAHLQCLEEWKQGTLKTLEMVGPGDFLAVKFTGAGPIAVNALQSGREMPAPIQAAMDQVCAQTLAQGSRLWIDAEQQSMQHTVDEWTIALMRRWNRNGTALVYNTIQAYLKASHDNVNRHVQLAAEEGWALGIKLVRGAYIDHEKRSLIHDTKEATDANYDAIARDLINRQLPPGTKPGLQFPPTQLFIASHNSESFHQALSAYRARIAEGKPTIELEFGQLQGMADEIGCEILSKCEKAEKETGVAAPKMFKFLPWGTLAECLAYLHRRSVENRGAIGRTKEEAVKLRGELMRRVLG